jgi:hypothetical protein
MVVDVSVELVDVSAGWVEVVSPPESSPQAARTSENASTGMSLRITKKVVGSCEVNET